MSHGPDATGSDGLVERAKPPRSWGAVRDLNLRLMLSSFLFLYVGFILTVFLSNVIWLGRENQQTHESYLAMLLRAREMMGGLWFSIKLSLATSAITSVLGMLVAIPSAYVLSRYKFRLLSFIDTVIDLPIVVPPLIAGLALLIFFTRSPIGSYIDEDVINIVFKPAGIVVAQFFVASAFSIRALKSTFDQINPRFEAVARSLGCTSWQAMWRIALPLAKNGIIAGLIMTWARALGEFGPIMILAGATPGKTDVLSVAAFLNMASGKVEVAIAIVVLMVLVATFTLITFKKLGGRGYIW
jgi:molybdate transport system permease protein